ncbi:unnamed protein product [Spirodela intermedia]|uniref:Uncharacterized protein n=1 Tax=Spirodela intermedia TaxID=51605 RepID=A0A7I8K4T0_SPIIN|nr:unnamed protein product [Spirodela intermedia]
MPWSRAPHSPGLDRLCETEMRRYCSSSLVSQIDIGTGSSYSPMPGTRGSTELMDDMEDEQGDGEDE